MVVAVRSLSRSEQVETLLAGPSPISPMKAEITISPISNAFRIPITQNLLCASEYKIIGRIFVPVVAVVGGKLGGSR